MRRAQEHTSPLFKTQDSGLFHCRERGREEGTEREDRGEKKVKRRKEEGTEEVGKREEK